MEEISRVENRNTDRRQSNVYVKNDRRSGIDRREVQKTLPETTLLCAFEALPPVRRLTSLPDKMDRGEYISAIGAAGLALINLPEDIRDMSSAKKQIKSYMGGEKFTPIYNYKEYQHPFSFFKGTLLHDFVDPNKTKYPKLAEKLLNMDTMFSSTKSGKKILNLMGVKELQQIETKIESIGHTKEMPIYIYAKKYEGSTFGIMTARAMTRTTLLGIGALGLLELPKLYKAFNKSDDLVDKTENIAGQVVKSAASVAITTAGIGYGGAIGAKKFGPAGSLIGMGFSAILSTLTSKKVQELIG